MAAAQTVTLKVRCVESGRHPLAGEKGELRLSVQQGPEGPMAAAEFLHGGRRMRFAGLLAPLTTGDRPTALRVHSPRTRYLFDVLPAGDAPRPAEARQYAICRDGVPLRGCDAVPATHENVEVGQSFVPQRLLTRRA